MRHLAGDKIDPFSAGVEPTSVNPNAIEVMKEIGIDISNQKSKHQNEFVSEKLDYVITVCEEAVQNCPIFPGIAEMIHWYFDDPSVYKGDPEFVLSQFRRIRDEIRRKIEDWIKTV